MILLDLDGVCCDFVTAALDLYDTQLAHDDILHYHFFGRLNTSVSEFYEKVDAMGPSFWTDMAPYPWFEELYAYLRAQDRVVFLTADTPSKYCLSGKKTWLEKHASIDGVSPDFIMCPAHIKQLVARPDRLLIDDYEDNRSQWLNAGGKCFLWPMPWNENRHIEKAEGKMERLRLALAEGKRG